LIVTSCTANSPGPSGESPNGRQDEFGTGAAEDGGAETRTENNAAQKPPQGRAGSPNGSNQQSAGGNVTNNNFNSQNYNTGGFVPNATNAGGSGGNQSGSQGQNSNNAQNETNQTLPPVNSGTTGSSGAQCRSVNPRLSSSGGLGLAESFGGNSDNLPMTVILQVTRRSKGADGQEGTTNGNCTGFLYQHIQTIGLQIEGKGQAGESMYGVFPRIALSKHCVVSEAGSEITELTFKSSRESTDDTKYGIDANGLTTIAGDANKPGPWFLDKAQLANNDAKKDPCTIDPQGILPNLTYTNKACFTVSSDRIDLISDVEMRARIFEKTSPNFFGLSKDDLALVRKGVTTSDKFKDSKINWSELFASPRVKNLSVMYMHDNRAFTSSEHWMFAELYPKDEDEAYAILAQRLRKVSIVSSIIRGVNDRTEYTLTPENNSWKGILKIYGDMSGIGWRKGKSFNHFKVSAIGIDTLQRRIPLTDGHSGTLMLGHMGTVSRPLMTVYNYRKLIGVLSTKGGKPVCTGDDLVCCEKIQ